MKLYIYFSFQSVLLVMTEFVTLRLATRTLSWMCWRKRILQSTGSSGYTRYIWTHLCIFNRYCPSKPSELPLMISCFTSTGQRPGQPWPLKNVKPQIPPLSGSHSTERLRPPYHDLRRKREDFYTFVVIAERDFLFVSFFFFVLFDCQMWCLLGAEGVRLSPEKVRKRFISHFCNQLAR